MRHAWPATCPDTARLPGDHSDRQGKAERPGKKQAEGRRGPPRGNWTLPRRPRLPEENRHGHRPRPATAPGGAPPRRGDPRSRPRRPVVRDPAGRPDPGRPAGRRHAPGNQTGGLAGRGRGRARAARPLSPPRCADVPGGGARRPADLRLPRRPGRRRRHHRGRAGAARLSPGRQGQRHAHLPLAGGRRCRVRLDGAR